MSKTFRAWDVDQVWLLPPSVQDLLPAGHVAHFVRDGLDLSAIMAAYDEDRGYPPYHLGMMTALLLYGYSQGVYASPRLARACEERLDFAAVTGMQRPDLRTISDFRKRHLAALSGLFVQVLALCRAAGLAKLRHVALDGTKLKANASKHKAMSYARMQTAEAELAAQVAAWLREAAASDAAEDRRHGAGQRGDDAGLDRRQAAAPGDDPRGQGASRGGGGRRARRRWERRRRNGQAWAQGEAAERPAGRQGAATSPIRRAGS